MAETFDVRVSQIVNNIVDNFFARLELLLCRFHLYPLNIFGNRMAGGYFKSPFQVSAAQKNMLRQLLHTYLLPVALLYVILRFQYTFVTMFFIALRVWAPILSTKLKTVFGD